jgi:hypothetical protein
MAAPSAVASVAVGTHVRVSHAHVGALPATVDACDGGVLVAVLAVPDSRLGRLAGQEIAIEVTSNSGIMRYKGVLEPIEGRAVEVRVVLSSETERIQRRAWARVDAVLPVGVRGIDEEIGGLTSTLNVSGGGLLIKDPWRLPLGLDVRLELEVVTGEPLLRAVGRVIREATPEQKGIRIDAILRTDEERLVHLVRDRERAALRMLRGGR